MSSKCTFVLDHPNRVYYSGQTINGTINLTTAKDKNVSHVQIVFLGKGKVKWTRNTKHSHITYRSRECYINHVKCVQGDGTLPQGLHTYTFSIPLPVQCPSSCEGKYGHISYVLSLVLDRSNRFNNVYNIPLTILQIVDLNLNPTFKCPVQAEEIGSLCFWTCSKGKVLYSLRTPIGAYTPGQTVNYSLSIKNQSLTAVGGYTLEFKQKMTFTAKSPNHKQRHRKHVLVQQCSSEKCLGLTNRIFEGQFRIPSVPATTDPNCIIRIAYKLKITVHTSGCHTAKTISVPIYIGNIPLRETLSTSHAVEAQETQITPTTSESVLTKEGMVNTDLPPSYQDLKPPSYEATVQNCPPFVDDDEDRHHTVLDFKPLYPMYS